MEMKVGKHSIIEMHELVFHKENDAEVVIGRTETRTFTVLPAIGHETIEYLQRGLTIGETEHILVQKYAEPFDVSAIVEELIEDHKLEYRLDGNIVNSRVQIKFAILLSAAGIAFFHPAYIPRYKDFLLTPSTPLNILYSLAAAWFFLFLHEFAHLISARSFWSQLQYRTRPQVDISCRRNRYVRHCRCSAKSKI
ncbi:hypothetical protein [Paenibacillus andongensis]|uniref:hypothetical protein n=1 Tax=Paenibacillus andongensis TaxID=2975482 RepID=UPI0021BAFF90|nr:hypothetical protein [Paenibacillus andongensis]